jgi:hypothetical protein
VANDDRLARKAIDDFHASRLPDGLTQCRYPSRRVQILPTFSLQWIGMLHDLHLYRGDVEFVRPYLPAARGVLAWFGRRRRGDGLLGLVEHAPFVDWSAGFACGNAPQDADGGSSILALLFAQALRWQADLERACGDAASADRWQRLHRSVLRAVGEHCWDAKRRLFADAPARRSFSLHAQVEAVLAGALPASRARTLLRQAVLDDHITQPGTFYYRYYLAQALRMCGLHDLLLGMFDRWQRCLEGTGLTTWPETDRPDPRSDCHAWSVTPAIEMLQTVLGITPDPAAPGFARARLQPRLGALPSASGMVPTPHGDITVHLERVGDGHALLIDVQTPVPSRLVATGRLLPPGRHRLTLDRD